MIIIVPILFYLIFVICLILIVNYLFKNKTESVQKRIKKWIIGLAVVLFFPIAFLYFSHLLGIALKDHYDVKKGTFLWFATMDNRTITKFPVIEPIADATYNKIGGDDPTIATGWGIEYETRADIETLTEELIEYLKKDGFELSEVDETQYYWTGKHKRNEDTQLISGFNKKGESLDLLIQKQVDGTIRVKCTIVY